MNMRQLNLIETREPWELTVEHIELLQEILDQEAAAYKARIKSTELDMKRLKEQLKVQCRHPQDKIERRNHTIPGSYLDVAEYTEWFVCTVCGGESEKKVTHGGYG